MNSVLGYSLFVIIIFITVIHMPQQSTAAALTKNAATEFDSPESVEDALNMLHELSRFIHGEHQVDGDGAKVRHVFKRQNIMHTSVKSADIPAWQNVCSQDNVWSGDELPEDLSDDYIKLYMRHLRKVVRLEYKTLKTNGFDDIDIDDMQAWRRHEHKYKFLPTLKHNATIAPICWHQSLQKFIASFDYLYQIQQQWDHQHQRPQSGITRELHELLQSSKRILCETETAINGCFPRNRRQLLTITREEMTEILNFYTTSQTSTELGVNHTDMRFLKFFYQNYLLRLWKTLPCNPHQIKLESTCVNAVTYTRN
ncbi:uncharacterized protein LOC110119138 isoform X2 [Ceratitis capitata]|nr:uncharacterized protein LOC110119138 isoform X2 [Ceratitis capitata]